MHETDLAARSTEIEERSFELVKLTSDLVRIDSQNNPPRGKEHDCQAMIHDFMRAAGMEARLVSLDSVAGLKGHPLYWDGRDYTGRPNVLARFPGAGGGKSLLFSGHIDTMPPSPGTWRFNPFTPHVEKGSLYGLGSCDMKGGLAAAMFVLKLIREWDLKPGADVLFESVVDEEHAGCNGTLANRLLGHNAEGTVLPEPSCLEIYPAHKGFRIVHICLKGKGGISFSGEEPLNPVEQVGALIGVLQEFRRLRRQTAVIPVSYRHDPDPVPVMLPKLQAGEFSYRVPMQIPEELRLEVYWQTLPGETQEAVERQFFEFMSTRLREIGLSDALEVSYVFSHRWMPGTAMDSGHPFVSAACSSFAAASGCSAAPRGAPYPCDLFVFKHFNLPALVLGPKGLNAHAPDEHVDIESLVTLAKTFLHLIDEWCGLKEAR